MRLILSEMRQRLGFVIDVLYAPPKMHPLSFFVVLIKWRLPFHQIYPNLPLGSFSVGFLHREWFHVVAPRNATSAGCHRTFSHLLKGLVAGSRKLGHPFQIQCGIGVAVVNRATCRIGPLTQRHRQHIPFGPQHEQFLLLRYHMINCHYKTGAHDHLAFSAGPQNFLTKRYATKSALIRHRRFAMLPD